MSKKPVQNQLTVSRNEDLHLGLDFAYDDSEEDLYGDSDLGDLSGSEDDFESELEELAGDSIDHTHVHPTHSQHHAKPRGTGLSNGDSLALVPTGEAAKDAYDVDSDEEKDLLKGIKDEIRDMVRGEMQSELRVYEHKMKAIEAGRLPSADGGGKEEDKYPDLADMEPQLREAYIKMRKLDRILDKRVKKEREVKRDRILLERRIREEISAMQTNGKMQKDIKTNTEKYLALALPPSHNQGVIVDEPPVTPVFQTQVNEHDLEGRGQKAAGAQASRGSGTVTSSARGQREDSAASSRTDITDSSLGGSRSGKHGRRRRKKDFIKRNKELAANAQDMIAMTDDEKKRLQELLSDVDALPEIPEEGLDTSSVDLNPYQVAIKPGEGFMPSDTELRSLTAIDQRLQSILPEDQFRSIASSVLSHVPQQRLFTRTGARSEVDFEEYGEKALMETKEEREVTLKLKEIEDRLSHFHDTEQTQSESGALSEEQLENLLDDCVRSMSAISLPANTPDSIPDSSRTLESARAQLFVNPPKLSEETLQRLLSEAHFPLSSQLLALQDDDSKSAHNEEDGGPIRAETWKAIAEATLSEDEDVQCNGTTMLQEEENVPSVPQSSHTQNSAGFPRVAVSDTALNPNLSRKPPFYRYSSQASDSDGRDSRVSLPEISTTPLINTAQGGGTSTSNNDPLQYYMNRTRNNASLENMVHNDLSRERSLEGQKAFEGLRSFEGERSFQVFRSYESQRSSEGQRPVGMAGTPLDLEEIGDQETTPTPHPPSADRSSSRRSLKTRKNSIG